MNEFLKVQKARTFAFIPIYGFLKTAISPDPRGTLFTIYINCIYFLVGQQIRQAIIGICHLPVRKP